MNKNVPLYLIIAGTVLSAVSNSLPWVSMKLDLPGEAMKAPTVNGWDRDGAIIFAFAVIALILSLIKGGQGKKKALSVLILSAVALLIALYDFISVRNELSKLEAVWAGLGGGVSVGSGMYLAVVAAAVLTAGAFLLWKARLSSQASPPPLPPSGPYVPPPA